YPPTRFLASEDPFGDSRNQRLRDAFRAQLHAARESLARYSSQLQKQIDEEPLLGDRSTETKLVREIQQKLNQVSAAIENEEFLINQRSPYIDEDLHELSERVHELPTHLHTRLREFRDQVRSRYRTWYGFILLAALGSFLILGTAFVFFRRSIVQPFKELLSGTRLIAKGNFDHRIDLDSQDELSELADALNAMTNRFVEIREHLNEKVKERTREVVRSEQLASVGFLAAGVAHEINNPLASIAWSAEALESRLHEILHCGASPTEKYDPSELEVLRKYLKRIQDEAFRCKGITERLLDFSRLGESQRKQSSDVNELVSDVIGLVEHLSPYRSKKIEFIAQPGLTAWVSPPEFKQVVLNILTNALDSTDEAGEVRVELQHDAQVMRLVVTDNGCGMTEEVLKHLYEPFYTRRRDGKGTGLGLSITYRIVQDHGGEIAATSEGPGRGSRFQITLPLEPETTSVHEPQKYAA
ncbi:MAG: sensor histidine kinase, partial [Aureliella sp.]